MYLVQGEYENAVNYCRGIAQNAGFEFCFGYVSEREVFKEINRFIWESRIDLAERYEGKMLFVEKELINLNRVKILSVE